MRFFTDVHVPREAVQQLRNKGVDVIHASEVGLDNEKDEILMNYAVNYERTMVSCDRDFADMHYDYIDADIQHYGVVYFTMNVNCNISVIVNTLYEVVQLAEFDNELVNVLWEIE